MTNDSFGDQVDDVVEADTAAARRGRLGVPSIVVAILFGLFYAYDVWEAVSSLVELPADYAAYDLDTADLPWWLLIVNLLVPIVVYALAFVIGRRHNFFSKALIFIAGLVLVAALSLDAIALIQFV